MEVPAGLGEAGAGLWGDVAGKFELRADELRVLEAAAREADLLAVLEAGMVGEPLMVKGSQGQPVIHPLISEVRQHRLTQAGLLKQLRLPDVNDSAEARSAAARAAVNVRWAKRGA